MLAQNTRYLLDSLGVKELQVLGHSMGGMLATRFALMYPEMVTKLILLNPIGLEDWKAKGVPYKPVSWWYENEMKSDYQRISRKVTTMGSGSPSMIRGCIFLPDEPFMKTMSGLPGMLHSLMK